MKRKSKGIAIGMVALATLFGGAQPAMQAKQMNVPSSERQTKPNEAIIPQAKPGISRSVKNLSFRGLLRLLKITAIIILPRLFGTAKANVQSTSIKKGMVNH